MLIDEADTEQLKSWVIQKLQDISVDADGDVLADYVIALVKTDAPSEAQLRQDVNDNLEDFLKESTAPFVNDIFHAIEVQAYKPGYVPQPTRSAVPAVELINDTMAETYVDYTGGNGEINTSAPGVRGRGAYLNLGAGRGTPNGSRKRSFNDSQGTGPGSDAHYGRNDRQIKQMRRGRGGRGGSDMRGGGFQNGYPQAGSPTSPQGFPNMSQLPQMPPGMGFDPNDPMAAMMAMQAMGMPPLPGMPGYPLSGSPKSQQKSQNQRKGGTRKEKCRDYHGKGFCPRGDACSFMHDTNRVIVPGQDEYDPKNATIMDAMPTSPIFGNVLQPNGRGDNSSRGRGRGRGNDRGGGSFPPRRNRAEFSQAGPNNDRSITTIVVEQIPEEQFSESAVRDFFSEFGSIEEVTMQPYKRLALVKYSDYFAARSAYDSPKVIFDNRFVKVYWYKPGAVPTPPHASTTMNTDGPDGQNPASNDEEPFDRAAFEANALAAQKKLEDKKAAMSAMTAKREALEKQKADLVAKQAAEKQKLLDRLAAKGISMTPSDTNGSDSKEASNGTSTEKENDENVSEHTKLLRAKVAELEAEAKSLGLPDPALADSNSTWSPRGRGRGRGRGSYRGWEGFDPSYRGRGRGGRGGSNLSPFVPARGGSTGKYNLDNRPKKISVAFLASPTSEWTPEQDEGLRQHLLGIGEFEDIQPLPDTPSTQIVSFRDRATAELFKGGSKIKEIAGVGKVELAWVSTPLAPVKLNADGTVGKVGGGGEEDADVGMGGTMDEKSTEEPQPQQQQQQPQQQQQQHGEADYDVAEEDDWGMVA